MTSRTEDLDLAPVPALAPETELADRPNELDTTARPRGPAQGPTPLIANHASTAAVIPARGPERIPRDRGLVPATGTVAADHIAPDLDRTIGQGVEVARVPMTDEIVAIIMNLLDAGDTAAPGLTLDLDPARPRLNAAGRQSTRKSASSSLRLRKG